MSLNRGWSYRERVRGIRAGECLEDFLARRFRHTDAAAWRERVGLGRVDVDGVVARAGAEIRDGQIVVWHRPPWQEPDAPTDWTIIHEDNLVVAVDKPAGLPTLPGAGFLENTLWSRVRERFPGASPVHRLGRWTSGIVLFGRTALARAELAEQWRGGKIEKTYLAVASGVPETERLEIDVPIGPVAYEPLGTVHAATERGRRALTRVTVLRPLEEGFLAQAEPVTGRPHQIRIHFAAAGHPLIGDPLYTAGGLPGPGSTAVPGDRGYRLHAARLGWRHPVTGTPRTIECAPPGDWP